MLSILFTALLPVVILAVIIYRQDKAAPEPIGQLLLGFVYGVVSLFLSLAISLPWCELGLYSMDTQTVWDGIRKAFFGAAIPEELAKLYMLWVLLRRNKHFDEKLDGIVYAVCIALGFAAVENFLYLWQDEDWLSVGIARAIYAVPGHCCDGILMGYYYSLVKFSTHHRTKNMILLFIMPILAHGIYDALLMIVPHVSEYVSGFVVSTFAIFCYLLWKYCYRQVQKHQQADEADRMADAIDSISTEE